MRHLKNISELSTYASLTTLAIFLGRAYNDFEIPVLMATLAIASYCFYLLSVESKKPVAYLILFAILIGFFGSYYDYMKLLMKYTPNLVMVRVLGFSTGIVMLFLGVKYYAKK